MILIYRYLIVIGFIILLVCTAWFFIYLKKIKTEGREKESRKVCQVRIRSVSPPVERSQVKTSTRVIISHRDTVEIKRAQVPYWQERSWQKNSGTYRGYYRTRYGSFEGEIKHRYDNTFDFYIFNPPKELEKHNHWVCFRHQGKNKYLLHFATKPKDVSSGIMAMEKLIKEAFEIA